MVQHVLQFRVVILFILYFKRKRRKSPHFDEAILDNDVNNLEKLAIHRHQVRDGVKRLFFKAAR